MSDPLVIVATFPSAAEAHLAKNRLVANKIAAVVTDELLPEMLPGGSVNVQVAKGDAERATKILGRRPSRRGARASNLPGDQLAVQAVNWATLGLFICPVILHLYSTYFLLRLRRSGLGLSAGGRKQAREARLINLI